MNLMQASFGRGRHLTTTHRGGDGVLGGRGTIELQQPFPNKSRATAPLDMRGSAALPAPGTWNPIPWHQLLTVDGVALMPRVTRSLVGMGTWRMGPRLRLAGDAYTEFACGAGVSGFVSMRIEYRATPGDAGREVATVKRAWVGDGCPYGEREGEDQPPSRRLSGR
jgi:hypothetical protein